MELIERYVAEVGRRVPTTKRTEVVAELRSAILDALEGRGAQTDDDVVAVLREFGDPPAVAAAYAPERQYLIGPELFPSFVQALRTMLSVLPLVVGAWLLAAVARRPANWVDGGELLLDAIDFAVHIGLMGAAIIVGVFVAMQWRGERPTTKDEWNPRALPAASDVDRQSRVEAAFTLAVTVAVALFIGSLATSVPPGMSETMAPLVIDVLRIALPILMVSLVLEALVWAVVLVQGRWRGGTRAARVLADAIAFLAFVLAPLELASRRGGLESLGVPSAVVTSVLVTLWIVAGAILLDTATRELRAWRRRRSPVSPEATWARGDDRPTPPTERTARA